MKNLSTAAFDIYHRQTPPEILTMEISMIRFYFKFTLIVRTISSMSVEISIVDVEISKTTLLELT